MLWVLKWGRETDRKLKNVIVNILKLASEKKFKSISMPAISSGIFGFPKDRCAKILVGESKKFVKENQGTSLDLIEFCIYDDETYDHFQKEFAFTSTEDDAN